MKKHLAPLILSISFALAAPLVACSHSTVGERSAPILEGQFGDLEDFSGAPELRDGYVYGESTHLDIRTRGDGWVVMAALDLDGRLGEGDLVPGAEIHATAPDDGWWEEGGVPAVTMLGCAGEADDNWTIDCAPEEIFVTLAEGTEEGTLLLNFEAIFPDDCHGGVIPGEPPPGGTEPGEPPPPGVEPGEPPPGGSEPGEPPPPGVEPGEPPPGGSEPGEPPPPGTEPGEPPPSGGEPTDPAEPQDFPATYAAASQVITGVIEIRLADLHEGGDRPAPDGPDFVDVAESGR